LARLPTWSTNQEAQVGCKHGTSLGYHRKSGYTRLWGRKPKEVKGVALS
jgi:hypothetical protein